MCVDLPSHEQLRVLCGHRHLLHQHPNHTPLPPPSGLLSPNISCPRAASTLAVPQGQPASALGTHLYQGTLPIGALLGTLSISLPPHPQKHTQLKCRGFHALGSLFPGGAMGYTFPPSAPHPFYSPEHSLSWTQANAFFLKPQEHSFLGL